MSQSSTNIKPVKQPPYFLNKVVVVTGASSGIGRAIAYWYLNNGARVALLGQSLDDLEAIGREYPTQSLVIQLDLTDDTNLLDSKNCIIEKWFGIDILINCAGVIFAGDLENTYPQDYDYMVDINVRTPFLLT